MGDAALSGNVLRLTRARPNKSDATWLSEKQPVRAGFDAVFRFQLMHPEWLFHGADGLAFVLQNSSPAALGGQGSAGGFGAPDPTNTHRAGIPWMASSTLSLVSSDITFLLSACLPNRHLCTPDHAIIESKASGYHIVCAARQVGMGR